MSVSASFLELAKESFAPFGAITARRMFGAAGLYCDGLFFAVVGDDAVYLKTDDDNRAEFERAGLLPFTFETKDGSMAVTSYYAAPEEIFEDSQACAHWTKLALDAASRAARFKKKRRPKRGARS